MRFGSLARLHAVFEEVFPERHIYVRSGGDMRAVVLTTGKQTFAAFLGALCALWIGVCTASMLINAFSVGGGDQEAAKICAYYERLIADRQARLNSAITQLSDNSGGVEQLAADVEKRNAALAMMISDAKDAPGLASAVKPRTDFNGFGTPLQRIRSVKTDQDRLIAEAASYSKSRAERLRIAMRMAGLNPASYSGAGEGLGGPLIDAKDPRALAAILDVDEDFAARIRDAAVNLDDMRALAATTAKLPLSKPTEAARAVQRLWRADRSVQRSPRLPSRPGLRRRHGHAYPCDRSRRGFLHRGALRIRQHHRGRPRRRVQDPLRPPVRHRREGGPARGPRRAYRRHGLHRTIHRAASAL